MKIIIIGTVASSLYVFRAELISALIIANHQVYAFTNENAAEGLLKIRQLGAIPVSYQLSRGGLNPIKDLTATAFLAKKIRRISPDLVLSYFSKPVIFGTLAAKIARVPKVIGMLEGLGFAFTDQPQGLSNKSKLIKAIQVGLYKVILPQLDSLIFLNPDDPKDLVEKYSIKIRNLHILGGIGLNLEHYPYQPVPASIDAINFLFIGRLLKEKGIHEFISAAKIVKDQYPIANFIVLGATDKSNPGALQSTDLDHLVQSGLIQYPGQVNNISEWIANSHVFVLPSYREGVPRSTQEAMAVGRPVITTDVPGCRETVVNECNGFLVERWNAEQLAENMIYFINNPDQIETMGLKSYAIAQDKYDSHKVTKRLIDILALSTES